MLKWSTWTRIGMLVLFFPLLYFLPDSVVSALIKTPHALPTWPWNQQRPSEREPRITLVFSAAFVNCLRGKISLPEMLTLSYPLLSKGEPRVGRNCWRMGGSTRGGICAHYPKLLTCRRRAGNSRPLSCQADSHPRCHRHFIVIIMKAESASPVFIRRGNKQKLAD